MHVEKKEFFNVVEFEKGQGRDGFTPEGSLCGGHTGTET